MRRNHVFGFALALAAATTAQTASAQQTQPQGQEQRAQDGRREPGGGQFQRLLQGIDLTDAQQQQIQRIFAEGRPQGQRGQQGEGRQWGQQGGGQRGERPELTDAQRAEMQKRRAEMQQRREQQMNRIRGILNADQRAQFDRNVAQAEAQRQQRGDRQGGDRGQGGRF